MSKQITAAELAQLVSNLLKRENTTELDSFEMYQSFMTGVAKLLCEHFGGHVNHDADEVDGEWMIGVLGDDSLPDDGGIWAKFDPEGSLYPDGALRTSLLVASVSTATGT